jgi:hypothetical protein
MVMRCLCVRTLLLLAACGDDVTSNVVAGHVAEVSDIAVAPALRHCGGVPETLLPVQIDLTVVNTRPDTITVNSIDLVGVVLRASFASEQALVGKTVYNLPGIEFSPRPAILRAHDGQVRLHAFLRANCAGRSFDVVLHTTLNTTIGPLSASAVTLRHTEQ